MNKIICHKASCKSIACATLLYFHLGHVGNKSAKGAGVYLTQAEVTG